LAEFCHFIMDIQFVLVRLPPPVPWESLPTSSESEKLSLNAQLSLARVRVVTSSLIQFLQIGHDSGPITATTTSGAAP
jgi:hypothetical protein